MAKILVINGSPRTKSNSAILAELAAKGASSVKDMEVSIFSFAGKQFYGCTGMCHAFCQNSGTCCQDDGFNDFADAWLEADGIVWVVPTYHAGPPAQIKAVLDRLGNSLFSVTRGKIARFNKPTGIIVNGTSRFGCQELVMQFFLTSIPNMKCLPIAGDSPKAGIAAIGQAPTWEPGCIEEDKAVVEASKVMGRRVAEMTKIIVKGLEACKDELDETYSAKEYMMNCRGKGAETDPNWRRAAEK